METKRVLFADGDSWTFGSEIAAPELLSEDGKGFGQGNRFKDTNITCTHPSNDYYRIPRIWPTILAEKLGVECVNRAWPARSNDTIIASTLGWIMDNYIVPGKDTSELLVVVGWTSPERKNVIVEESNGLPTQYTFWPNMLGTDFYKGKIGKKYFEFYINHLWHEREYISRFIEQNYTLDLFCKAHGIEYRTFNAFYVPRAKAGNSTQFANWKDASLIDILNEWEQHPMDSWGDRFHWNIQEHRRLKQMWESITTMINKDKLDGSFKSFVENNLEQDKRWCGIHPSPEGNAAWADYLYDTITK